MLTMAERGSSWFWFTIVSLALVAPSFSGEESESKEFVLALDKSNFSDTVSKHKFIVVEFYAPWCGHCNKLAPEYEKAASILSSHDPPVFLAKVDANNEVNRELASQYDVRGYPTLKILRDGGKSIQDYKGPRDAEGIVAYLKKQSGPASIEIKTTGEAINLIGDNKIVVVGIFNEFSGEEFENFTAVAEKLRADYDFGHTLDAKRLPRGDSFVKGPVIRLFKPFDELFIDSKDFNIDAIQKLVEDSCIPLVTIFDKDPNNHPFVVKFFNKANAKAMLFMNFGSDIADSFKSKYREIAESYRGEGISFLLGDVESSHGAFQFFGLKDTQAPLIIIQTTDGQKYLKANLEPDQIATWMKDFKDGKASPYSKSEPIPAKNEDPVKVIVADSLQDMVFSSGKNVLLEFYAPWCGHCKKLAPILDEVAITYEKDSDVMIAKMDATANDYPAGTFDVKGYPTMYLKSAGGKVVRYEGNRSKDDIIGFIEKNRDKATAKEEEPPKDEL